MIEERDGASPPPEQIVERDGIALVHEGERIIATSAAAAVVAAAPSGTTYTFPVEIEIVGSSLREEIIARVYAELYEGIAGIA